MSAPTRPLRFADLGVRDRKRARLRLSLLEEARARIDETGFEAIRVKDLADAAEITQPTFFAQFPTKTALLAYHIHIWRIETILYAQRADTDFVRAFFDKTAADIISGPNLWFAITAEIANGGGVCTSVAITDAERLLVFNDDPAALDVDPVPQQELFRDHLSARIGDRRLGEVVDDLLAVFYGTPLALGQERLAELPGAYRRSVDALLPDLDREAE